MRKKIIIGGATAFGLGTLLFTTGLLKPTVKLVALSSLGVIPISIIVSENIHRKANQKVLSLEKTLGDTKASLKQLKNVRDDNRKLASSLNEMQFKLTNAQSSLFNLEAEYKKLESSYRVIEAQCEVLKSQQVELSEQVTEYEESYSNELESEVQQKVQEYIAQDREALKSKYRALLEEGEVIYAEAMSISEKYKAWAGEVAKRHQDRKAYIMGLTGEFNKRIGEAQGAWEVERGLLLTQIETLNEKVARLQQQLAGDLIEPELLSCKFAIPGQIANELAKLIWKGFSIPLAAKGAQLRSNGLIEIGYSYSMSQPPSELVALLSRHTDSLVKELGIHKITSIREHDLSPLIVVGLRREPEIKEDTAKLLAGSPEEFVDYIISHPIRYRLIADPGQGKTPTTAVMLSVILKAGGTYGNTGKGKKIPHTLVNVSCPDVTSSQKDIDYPLEIFLKYGDTTAALKSFDEALEDWKYRKRNTVYAQNFFQIWVWDELDNTLGSASDPKSVGAEVKKILKQCHHTGVGWIVSGQSMMTSEIPGFRDDDRELFTQIIIGTTKIRKYLEKYGKKVLSAKVAAQLLKNVDSLEPYIDDKNEIITDTARLLRLALVLDERSPKLYFLPNLDQVKFDVEKIEYVLTKAAQMKTQFLTQASGQVRADLGNDSSKNHTELVSEL
ncbi:MAG: hypothetical protein F6K41_37130, partial [Symploca sp. SIO3E6]|nr:hypothetical protein [Caldora sp. SIO3E6]